MRFAHGNSFLFFQETEINVDEPEMMITSTQYEHQSDLSSL